MTNTDHGTFDEYVAQLVLRFASLKNRQGSEAFDNFVIGKNSLVFNGMARTAIIILVFIIASGLIFYAAR